MLNFFRKISLLEGISYLSLFFISMPLKYLFDYPEANKIVGYIHGFLFVTYLILVFMLKSEENWDFKKTTIILACSVIPFGTFWMDKKYLR